MELTQYWARTQPDSARAQKQMADREFLSGDFGAAVMRFEAARQKWPGDPSLVVALLGVGCLIPEGPVPSVEEFERSVQRFDARPPSTVNMFDRLVRQMEDGFCDRFKEPDLYPLFEAVSNSHHFRSQARNIALLRSRVAHLSGNRYGARYHLDSAIREGPTPQLLTQGVVWALEDGDINLARKYRDIAAAYRTPNPLRQWSYSATLRELEEVVASYEREHLESEAPADSGTGPRS